ncbi:hypothetical protein AALP_AA3G293300 [Arabis alpina]|uniref:Uncharacterized protein n=1 Tax=Arabis alpina TaxID=50452 RepID=A0A087HCH3_ARAAL|nr:hypothetical protein AALP_AA3G293300 [Arabis alpina]
MKAWVILLLVICAAAIVEQSEARKYLKPHVFNKCHLPNPPAGCYPHNSINKPPTPANTYRRGCSKIHRCRHD